MWWIELDCADATIHRLAAFLSTDELRRADRYVFQRDRRRFFAARGVLRHILGRYLCKAPEDIRFQYGAHGKPALAGSAGRTLRFNLSHAHELALCAFSTTLDPGIDVEHIRRVEDGPQLVQRCFTPTEIHVYSSLTQPEQRQLAFFQGWTRKEAFMKATGEGLVIPPDQVEVTLGPGEPAQFLNVPAPFRPAASWHLVDLPLNQAYCGALAMNRAAQRISYWRWAEQVGP